MTAVTVRATFFLLNLLSLSVRVLGDGHFGHLIHRFDLLTGLTPKRANDVVRRGSPDAQIFSLRMGPLFDPGLDERVG